MSYSRYLRIAIPRHTGSTTPTPTAVAPESSGGQVLMSMPATATADPVLPARRHIGPNIIEWILSFID